MLKKLYKDENYFVGYISGDERDENGIYRTPHNFYTEQDAIELYEELQVDVPEYKWTIFVEGHRTSKGEWLKPQEAWK